MQKHLLCHLIVSIPDSLPITDVSNFSVGSDTLIGVVKFYLVRCQQKQDRLAQATYDEISSILPLLASFLGLALSSTYFHVFHSH